MTTLVLARHGETVWHAENRYAGRTDVALTDRGRAQAAQLGQWAQVTQPTAVASSDLSRAVRTASPAAEALGLPLIVDPRMREVDFGDGEGLTTAEIRVRFPEALRRFHDHPATSPFPAGERGVDAVDRAWPALDALAEEYSGGTVLVVMHSTLLRLVLCRVLGVDLDRYRTLLPKVHNVALTSILWEDRKGLLSFNAPS